MSWYNKDQPKKSNNIQKQQFQPTQPTYYQPTLPSHCVDKDANCRFWPSYCKTNNYVKTNCRKTCDFSCSGVPTPPSNPTPPNNSIVQNTVKYVANNNIVQNPANLETPKKIYYKVYEKPIKIENAVNPKIVSTPTNAPIINTTKAQELIIVTKAAETTKSTQTTTKTPETTTKTPETTKKPLEATTTTVFERTTKIHPKIITTTTTAPTTTKPIFRQVVINPNQETLSQALARCAQVERATAQADAEMSANSGSSFVSRAPCQDHSDRCDMMKSYCDDTTVATLCAKSCDRCDLSKSKEEITQIRQNIEKQASKSKIDAKQNVDYLECQKIKEQQKVCVDMLDDDECAGYADYCDNKTMQKQCKRTCGVCSNPGEIITTTTTTTQAPRTAANGVCADKNPNCSQWENYCDMLDDVKQSCPVTCGSC
jgi:hypothetical protein